MNDKQMRETIQRMQNISLYVFVPATAIAIFTGNRFFGFITLISGITFGIATYLDSKI